MEFVDLNTNNIWLYPISKTKQIYRRVILLKTLMEKNSALPSNNIHTQNYAEKRKLKWNKGPIFDRSLKCFSNGIILCILLWFWKGYMFTMNLIMSTEIEVKKIRMKILRKKKIQNNTWWIGGYIAFKHTGHSKSSRTLLETATLDLTAFCEGSSACSLMSNISSIWGGATSGLIRISSKKGLPEAILLRKAARPM